MMPDLPSTRRSKIYQKNEWRTIVKWGCSKIQIDSNKPITKNNQILKIKIKRKKKYFIPGMLCISLFQALFLEFP
jgi:hypothetical protein